MPDEKMKQIGRLAMRHEGNFWNAYYALPETMNKALPLGSIAMKAIAFKKYEAALVAAEAEIARLKEALAHYRKIYGAPKIETGCIVSASDGTSVNAAVNGQALTGETDVQPTQSHQWHDQSELIAGETDDAR